MSQERCVLIWSEVTGLTEAERKAVHKRSGLTHPVACLNLVIVEQQESRWLEILVRSAQRTGGGESIV